MILRDSNNRSSAPNSARGKRDPKNMSDIDLRFYAQNLTYSENVNSEKVWRPIRKKVLPHTATLETQSPIFERRAKATVTNPDPLDGTRAGLPTSMLTDRPRGRKMIEYNPARDSKLEKPSVKVFEAVTTDPIAQQKDNLFEVKRKLCLKPIELKPTEEDQTHFTKKKRPPHDMNFSSVKSTMPLDSGGFYPEDSKFGLKAQTSKPKDHIDVLTYNYAGRLNENHSAPTSNQRHMERAKYEESIRGASKQNFMENAQMYNYFKQRRSLTSNTLTESLYNNKDAK